MALRSPEKQSFLISLIGTLSLIAAGAFGFECAAALISVFTYFLMLFAARRVITADFRKAPGRE